MPSCLVALREMGAEGGFGTTTDALRDCGRPMYRQNRDTAVSSGAGVCMV